MRDYRLIRSGNNKFGIDLLGRGHEPERDANCIKAWLRAQYAESIRERKAGSVDKDWELIGSVFHRWVRENNSRLGLGKAQENQNMMAVSFPFLPKRTDVSYIPASITHRSYERSTTTLTMILLGRIRCS